MLKQTKQEAAEVQRGQTAVHAATTESQEVFQANSDSYNGAIRENYSWSQDYSNVEVRVFVPKTVLKGRQVRVHLQSNSVCVRVNDEAGEKTLMEGKFTHRISTADSLWCLEPGVCVLLSLNKASEFWWSAVLVGEAEIDVDKIRKERFVENDEEHAVLDRLHFDAQQKLQGKPQSHEMQP
ncbi:nudC domain-containing protein 3-like isoform X2 [Gouania willdenowi]|uniref:NudC domain-containing protein 3 n=2 Tax=Gouania willdenowi TaxID=441366 RepID=A0A8C5E7M0_GOUWI|nr:nudC domain-containing protein 3-like isoform X2 [Gouania willdenowi]